MIKLVVDFRKVKSQAFCLMKAEYLNLLRLIVLAMSFLSLCSQQTEKMNVYIMRIY